MTLFAIDPAHDPDLDPEDREVAATLGLGPDDTWPVHGLDLVDDNTASTSCRHCHAATTAAGITNRGHGDGSTECARVLAWRAEP